MILRLAPAELQSGSPGRIAPGRKSGPVTIAPIGILYALGVIGSNESFIKSFEKNYENDNLG